MPFSESTVTQDLLVHCLIVALNRAKQTPYSFWQVDTGRVSKPSLCLIVTVPRKSEKTLSWLNLTMSWEWCLLPPNIPQINPRFPRIQCFAKEFQAHRVEVWHLQRRN